jgi:predicted alpha/beta-fold hydrolase
MTDSTEAPYQCKEDQICVCFSPVAIVDIVMFLPAETFDQSFFVAIVLKSLVKKVAQNSDTYPEKDSLCIRIMTDQIWHMMN